MGFHYENLLYPILKEAVLFQLSIDNSSSTFDQINADFPNLKKKADAFLVSLNNLNKEFEKEYNVISTTRFEKLRSRFAAIEHDWKEITRQINTNKFEEDNLIQWIERIYESILATEEIYGLNLNFDRSNRSLIEIINRNLPSIELSVFLLSQRIKALAKEKKNYTEDVSSVMLIKEIYRNHSDINMNLEDLKANNRWIDINQFYRVHADLSKKLSVFFAFLENSKTQDFNKLDLQKNAANASAVVERAFKLQDGLGDQLTWLLAEEKNVLNTRLLLGIIFIAFGTFIVLTLYMTRVIRRPLSDLKNAATELANGNLSVRVKISSNDEVAKMSRAFNKMAELFEEVMLKVGEISSHLSQSSSSIFSTAMKLEGNLEKQEQSIHQIANNAKGISVTVKDFAISLNDVNNAAALTNHLANLSRKTLAEMEIIMQQMANASTNIVRTLSDLKDKVGSIKAIISTIVQISDQVNLLSLNTAIRAGKKGLKHPGFSVIAEKIRELADQTAYATLDMEQVVQQIITTVMEAFTEVDNFSNKIQKQLEEAGEIREILKKLIGHTQTQISSFEIVNLGMQEQTPRTEQIHGTINRLTGASQRTIQSVRNLYLQIEYLFHASNHLHETTSSFTANSSPPPADDNL